MLNPMLQAISSCRGNCAVRMTAAPLANNNRSSGLITSVTLLISNSKGSGIPAKRSTAPLQVGAAPSSSTPRISSRPPRAIKAPPPIRSRPVRWSDPWVMSSSSPWPSVSSPITARALVSSQPPTNKPPRRSGEPPSSSSSSRTMWMGDSATPSP